MKNEDLPSVVPGFKFLGSPCNPCGALNSDADYSCPFSLDIGDGAEVSPIWSTLWKSGDGTGTGTGNTEDFPLLNELKKELDGVSNVYNPVVKKEGSDLNSNM